MARRDPGLARRRARPPGKHGLGLLSIGATTTGGFNALASNWAIADDKAAESRHDGRPQRLAPGRPDAHRRDAGEGARERALRPGEVAAATSRRSPLCRSRRQATADAIDALIESGLAVIGTPDDAIAQLERLETQSGGFGCFLQMAHNWADWAETKRSYELFARYVTPKFQALNGNREESYKVVGASHDATMGQARMAVGQRIVQHIQEKGTENVAPQILEALGLNKKPDAAE